MIKQFGAAVAVCVASAHGALADVYVCEFNEPEGSAIQQIVAVGIDESGERAFAFDPLINYVNEGPLDAAVVEETDAKFVTAWSMIVPDRRGQQARLRYRLSIFKERNQGIMRARAAGYSNRFEARGRCEVVPQSMQQYLRDQGL